MQPNRIGIAGDEFLDGEAVDQGFARDLLLLAVDEDRYGFSRPFAPRSLFWDVPPAFRIKSPLIDKPTA